ncbi:CTP-dependent riboflavin kinase [Halomarina pelagica]|uniref:CTP-dependent riboflavin kinase n=1 Tax=Halomarina pelagica TaxID=2961599 RepID=UPI0020C390C2|nr:CTP-dependent riboflavin kinase [Halomarina sp. BND7]
MSFEIKGAVTSGFGRGEEFVSLQGYARQFEEKLGYEPYPGTLNLNLPRPVTDELDGLQPVYIEEWSNAGRSFGGVDCYPTEMVNSDAFVRVHTIVPRRTDHDASTIELISPVGLRARYDLSDDDCVSIRVSSSDGGASNGT